MAKKDAKIRFQWWENLKEIHSTLGLWAIRKMTRL